MLFNSTIRKELSRNFGATLVVMVTIVITMMIIRILGHAAQGVINPAYNRDRGPASVLGLRVHSQY